MLAYEYVHDRPTRIRDEYGGSCFSEMRLCAGDVFFVRSTKKGRVFFYSGQGWPMQVDKARALRFVRTRCAYSEANTKAVKAIEELGYRLGDHAYYVTHLDEFEYCDRATLIVVGGIPFIRPSNSYKLDNLPLGSVKLLRTPKVYDPEQDLKLAETILKRWNFMSPKPRFALQRIEARLREHEKRVFYAGRYMELWKIHGKDPYKSGEYLEWVRRKLAKNATQ